MQARNRRVFILHAAAATGAIAMQGIAIAEEVSKVPVKEEEAYAKSMGFRLNSANVDKAKFPRHTTEQSCKSCQLFSGKDGETLGQCSFFKRMVPPDGWCRNFKPKKAAA